MIKLEITKSPELLAIGVYHYLFDEIFIGRSKKCDLIFLEHKFPLRYLTITANEKFLVIQCDSQAPFYFVNGKKTQGAFKLRINDIVVFGDHHIKILDFKKTTYAQDLTSFYEKVPTSSPKTRAALTLLENKLMQVEKEE
jgi:hypothetical protein